MKSVRLLVGLTAVAATAGLTAAPAHAATGLVDGELSALGTNCSWTDAVTSDVPPNTLTVDHTTVNVNCGSGITVTLGNSPTVTFDDAAGTATSPRMAVTGSGLGMTCEYEVTDVSVDRQGTTRSYTGGPFTATKLSGGFLCPSTATVDSATFSFH